MKATNQLRSIFFYSRNLRETLSTLFKDVLKFSFFAEYVKMCDNFASFSNMSVVPIQIMRRIRVSSIRL